MIEGVRNDAGMINYYLRPNKQVERKIILEILQTVISILEPSTNYQYVGMGSFYFFDFILMHKFLKIDDLVSIENKTDVKRFKFNLPYDFITFHNMLSTRYLAENHDWTQKSIIWLDYTQGLSGNHALSPDIDLIGKNSGGNAFFIITLNAMAPKDSITRSSFLTEFNRDISPLYNKFRYTSKSNYHLLLQNIVINKIEESCMRNTNKFIKTFSYLYQDGAPMYTLGGVFTDDSSLNERLKDLHPFLSTDRNNVTRIKIPNLTYKEKSYLDSIIKDLGLKMEECKKEVEKLCLKDDLEKEQYLSAIFSDHIAIELKPEEIQNYIQFYRYYPQYYEGII